MTPTSALAARTPAPHFSFSQLRTYLTCPLRYQFRYLARRPPERVGAAQLLGAALHAVLASYYASRQAGHPAPPPTLRAILAEELERQRLEAEAPLQFTADAPDWAAVAEQGQRLLGTFLAAAPAGLAGWSVVGVELFLAAPLLDEGGHPTATELVGILDLLLEDARGNLLVVDHKSGKTAFTQAGVDRDLQFSAYAALLSQTGYLAPHQDLACRFDLLRKLKTPKLERWETRRTPGDQRAFQKLATTVRRAIAEGLFWPAPGWSCATCAYPEACRRY